MSQSCIYVGTVWHRRLQPYHEFRNRVFMMYLDLAELPSLFDRFWLWSARSPSLAWFCRSDYLPRDQQDSACSLADSVRQRVFDQTGRRTCGPIRLLTQLRYCGFIINPISLYYCFNTNEQLEFVVAEVTNTPWDERHCYVLDVSDPGQGGNDLLQPFPAGQRSEPPSLRKCSVDKQLHVSPFMDLDYRYQFELSLPQNALYVQIENHRVSATGPGPGFCARLNLTRQPITHYNLARCLMRYPLMTIQIWLAIYWQALRLWIKGARFHSHPTQPGGKKKDKAERVAVEIGDRDLEKVTG